MGRRFVPFILSDGRMGTKLGGRRWAGRGTFGFIRGVAPPSIKSGRPEPG